MQKNAKAIKNAKILNSSVSVPGDSTANMKHNDENINNKFEYFLPFLNPISPRMITSIDIKPNRISKIETLICGKYNKIEVQKIVTMNIQKTLLKSLNFKTFSLTIIRSVTNIGNPA